jgi:O-acetyl-ADP-ribose deacetylase (regulator of RNase III)
MDEGTRFGRTVITAVVGDLVDQEVDVLVHPANSRGVMGMASPRSVRLLGGGEIEREAMRHAPLELGTALLTGSGLLVNRGIRGVIHAVIQPMLGTPVKVDTVRRAVAAALDVAEENGFRSVALPTLGAGSTVDTVERTAVLEAIVEEVVGHLRRVPTRFNRIALVSRFDDDVPRVAAVLMRARERSWIRPV